MDDSESGAEITGLEEIITPEVRDLSVEHSDDENDEELQTLATSAPFSVANISRQDQTDTNTHTCNLSSSQFQLSTDTSTQKGTSLSHSRYTCNNQGKEIKTKLCKNVARIVGETDNVYKLDTARQNMKKHPTSDFYKNNYQNLLAPVQTQILAQQTSLEKQHKEWEKQFYLNHECSEASLEDIRRDKEHYSSYKKMVLCQELLKHWNITVHL